MSDLTTHLSTLLTHLTNLPATTLHASLGSSDAEILITITSISILFTTQRQNLKQKGSAPSREPNERYNGGARDGLFSGGSGRIGVPRGLREAGGGGGGDEPERGPGDGAGGGGGGDDGNGRESEAEGAQQYLSGETMMEAIERSVQEGIRAGRMENQRNARLPIPLPPYRSGRFNDMESEAEGAQQYRSGLTLNEEVMRSVQAGLRAGRMENYRNARLPIPLPPYRSGRFNGMESEAENAQPRFSGFALWAILRGRRFDRIPGAGRITDSEPVRRPVLRSARTFNAEDWF